MTMYLSKFRTVHQRYKKKKPNLIGIKNGYPLVDTLLSTLYASNYLILKPLKYY